MKAVFPHPLPVTLHLALASSSASEGSVLAPALGKLPYLLIQLGEGSDLAPAPSAGNVGVITSLFLLGE